MTLQNGTYVPKTSKTVTVWPKADKDGDGPLVMRDMVDDQGNILGTDIVTDDQGNQLREYLPPDGFIEVRTREPGADRLTAAYVRGDGRGNVLRNLKGEAVGIKPGTVLVEHGDGTHTLLVSEWDKLVFERGHTTLDAPASPQGAPTSSQGVRYP